MTSTASVQRNEAMQAHEIAVTPPTVRTDDPMTKAVQVVVVVNRLPGPIVDDADRRETSSDALATQAAADALEGAAEADGYQAASPSRP